MSDTSRLPPGQFELEEFPRFGWGKFAFRFPPKTEGVEIAVGGDVGASLIVRDELGELPRVDQISDLHCVTTWSKCGLRWSGFRFRDFYQAIVEPKAARQPGADLVVLRSHDGYDQSLPLEDLLAPDILLADRLDGHPLSIAHGAPVRLVAPAHYGYKNVKHVCSIELGWTFLARPHWGGRFNGELKRLMLAHSFRLVRSVILYVSPTNIRSQLAVHRVGGVSRLLTK